MQTPKFPHIAKNLTRILSASSFKHVWKKKVRQRLNMSPLRDPIDNFDYHLDLDQKAKGLETKIRDGRYAPTAHKRYRVEKSKGLCRQIVYPSIEDCIILQTLSDSLYYAITKAQPTQNAYFEPDDGAFNKKFDELGASPYGSLKAWIEFQERLFAFTRSSKYLVVTDIANYYDFIKFDQLRNVIASISSSTGDPATSEDVLDMLIFILSGLSWQPDYMPRQLTGLPQIDIDAPRLLAHCFLFEVDRHIERDLKLEHARYMDDIDIGVDSIAEAKRALRDIDMIMQARQVRLNSGKTHILKSDEAYRHFCVRENYLISKWQKSIDKKREQRKPTARDAKLVEKIVRTGLRKKRFDVGSGGKLLKRLLTTATKLESTIRREDLDSIIRLRPAVRASALIHLGKRNIGVAEAAMFDRYLNEQVFVDDQSFFDITRLFLESDVKNDKRIRNVIKRYAEHLSTYSEFGAILSIRLAAKFLDPNEVLFFVGKTRSVWTPDHVLGRHVAGIAPLLLHSQGSYSQFRSSITIANNPGIDNVLGFFNDLVFDDPPKKAVLDYCSAVNPTRSLGANFEKICMLVALHKNKNLSLARRNKIFTNHARLINSISFRKFFS